MLPNLLEDPELHDRGDPAQTIFMEDEAAVLSFKMGRVFCPPKIASGNPCLEHIKYVILPWFRKFEVVQKEEDGGNKTFASVEELIFAYESGVVNSANLKLAFERALNKILQPVRDYFRGNNEAKALIHAVEQHALRNASARRG
ncbi:tyrosine--tRNA ligase 1, cytoplasmic-like [Phragmites australis]|uniref:tyrosine--tRNA ligase 1, cytoplasmic-like n=1 Tax=Phragmites australis TaxID=29695 RepID=UPI002D7913B0|nr:tyrosine--tRNA ligase 1, cytoplasmic-like [Phragmites australis]